MKGIRGAITADANTARSIEEATQALLKEILTRNDLRLEEIVSVVFTCTQDLTAAYPARAAREMGFSSVPMMCMQEMNVEHSLGKCIRVLLIVDVTRTFKHVYLKEAVCLRTDLV